MDNKKIESIKKYLGLDSTDDARKAEWIIEELRSYGDWGNKVATYFSSILSGTEGERSFISKEKVEAFKSMFKNINYGRND